MAIVVDSSIVIALAVREPIAPAIELHVARWAEDGEELHAPTLLVYEMANAFTQMVRRGRMRVTDVEDAWRFARGLDVQYHELIDLPSVVRFAMEMGRQSAYDASYLSLAQQLGAVIWTLDGRFARNAAGLGYPVRLIT